MAFLKRFTFILGVLFFGLSFDGAKAQSDARTHFIYIQSENQQPYYVLLNKKSYSSSSVGYLIISKLTDGDYNITIGFPQDAYPSQTYLLKIKGTDAGFNLLKGKEGKWDLIDKLSQNALTVVNTDGGNIETANNANSDSAVDAKSHLGFGALLSKTSSDTTDYKAYVSASKNNLGITGETPQEGKSGNNNDVVPATAVMPKKTRARNVQKTDSAASALSEKTALVKDDFSSETYESAAARSATQSIVKIGEHSDRRGISMAFVVASGEKIDTINTFFPGDSKKNILEEENDASRNGNDTTSSSVSPEKAALKKEVDSRAVSNNPFYKTTPLATDKKNTENLSLMQDETTTDNNKVKATKEDAIETSAKASSGKEIFNSTCTNILSDKEVEKIRKKMIAKSSDEDMIAVARKYIDTKCVYTSQIKELGGLLISDNGRFALYRILYPNVYDGSQFNILEDQLLDKNYKAQFQSMVNNR